MVKRCHWLWAAWIVLAVSAAQAAGTKADADKVLSPPAAADSATTNLSANQQQLAGEFKELEGILMKMRDQVRPSDPNRATLIETALKESGDRHVEADFQEIVDLLRRDKLGDAVRKQDKVNDDLDAILKLLLNEKRSQNDKNLIRQLLATVNRLITDQKDVQGRTAGGDDTKSLSGEQKALAGRAGDLSKAVQERDGKPGEKGDGKPGDKNDGKGKPGEKSDGKAKPGDGKAKPSDGKGKPSDGKPSDAKPGDGKGEPSDSKGKGKSQPGKGKGQPGQGESGEPPDSPPPPQDPNSPPQEENPLRKSLKAAEDNMKKAEDELKKANAKGAVPEQEKALENLKQAKEELEKILKQLREEEARQLLAALEARFKAILKVQLEIYAGTIRLDKIPLVERSHTYEIDTGRLSNREAEITALVDTALSQLREEGSSVAMPEAVQQVRDDMQQLVHRLAEGKTEVLTQNIEKDVINALQEIVDALHKEQQKNKKPKPSKPSKDAQPQDPPLIELLAELKMIKSLQLRVNRRTERYSKLIPADARGNGQATKEDVLDALQRLSVQEANVHKVTRELELGMNK